MADSPKSDKPPAGLFEFTGPTESQVGNVIIAPEEETPQGSWVGRLFRDNITRINSALRITGDLIYATSGMMFGSWARSVGAATAIGTTAFGLFYNQKEQASEELAAIEKMSRPTYIRHRLGQMTRPRENIRQTIGGGVSLAGLLYIVSGLESHRTMEVFLGGDLMVAGSLLSFVKDNRNAWQWFSAYLSTTIAPISVGNAIEAYHKGDCLVPLATTCFETANILTYCVNRWAKKQDSTRQLPAHKSWNIEKLLNVDEARKMEKSMFEFLNRRTTLLTLVTGQANGKECWAYARKTPQQYIQFKQVQAEGKSYNLADYASQILAYGIGHTPPREVQVEMAEKGFDPEFIGKLHKMTAQAIEPPAPANGRALG